MTKLEKLWNRLMRCTGPLPTITLWTERIAQLAHRAGLDVGLINWNGTPNDVGYLVVNYASENNGIKALEAQIAKAEKAQADGTDFL